MTANSLEEILVAQQHPPAFESVFVATDFSAGAGEALARVRLLPVARGGRITVVHVLPDGFPKKGRLSAEHIAKRHLEQVTKGLRKAVGDRGRKDVRVASEVCQGQAYVEIVRRARSVGAELIVLGRHGRRPVRDMFIGSTAERVIRAAALPVLVVSRKARRGYRRPVIAVDLGDTCRAVVGTALRIVEPDVASATMVHAYHVPFEGFMTPTVAPGDMTELRKEYRQTATAGLARLQASLEDLGIQWQTTLVRGDPRTAILTEALRRRADLLAVGTHGRTGISHALLGSVAEWVIQAATCDVLVARPTRVSFELP